MSSVSQPSAPEIMHIHPAEPDSTGSEPRHFFSNAFYRKPPAPIPETRDFSSASSIPLSPISFALTTFVFGLYQCGVGYVDKKVNATLDGISLWLILDHSLPYASPLGYIGQDHAIYGLATFYGGGAQFIAGVMEFRFGNVLASTIHCSYGAYWLAYSMLLLPEIGIRATYQGDDRAFGFAMGIFFILWSFLTLIFLLAALRTNLATIGFLVSLSISFFLLSVAQFTLTRYETASIRINRAGGVFAMFSALAAFYAGASTLFQAANSNIKLSPGQIFQARIERKEKA